MAATTYRTTRTLSENHNDVCADMREVFQDIPTWSVTLTALTILLARIYITLDDPIPGEVDLDYYHIEQVL